MYFGFKELPIDENGMPCEDWTGWKASCFILFFFVIYVGEVVIDDDPF